MRMIGTAVAIAAAMMIAAVGVAEAKGKKRGPAAQAFTVQCPVLAPVTATVGTCVGDRATCERQNLGCYVKAPKKAAGKAGKRKKAA